MQSRLAVDIGGTFTDFIAYAEQSGTYSISKVATTPVDLAEAVFAGIDSLDLPIDRLSFLVHGTTAGLNAFLQRNGERVLLLATAGTAHVYHIARGHRLTMYDAQYRKPAPLIPLDDIEEVRGRLNYRGQELEPLDEGDVERAIRRARDEGITSVAVALLFSYLNPSHELRVEDLIHESAPEMAVSLSHRVVREWREYERTSSTVLDAYIAPTVRSYLLDLECQTDRRGLRVPLHVMQSSGGILTAASARDRPLQTLLSGPVGGVMGGAALAAIVGSRNLICMDMGGTSFDVSLVVNGIPEIVPEMDFEGLPVLMSVVDIHTIGAGGGSMAYVEAGGLRVGPESAGAFPGPACYGRGGTRPTVTDANLLLGRIDADFFLGGAMKLDRDAAEKAVESVGQEIGLSAMSLATGIVDVINAKMAQAIRAITVEQGIEARDFTIVAFGGAGPMHAAFLARELDIPEVIIPRFPGAFSAWGMLQAPMRYDLTRMFYVGVSDLDLRDMAATYDELEAEGKTLLAHEGVPAESMRFVRSAAMRYLGQEHTISVAISHADLHSDNGMDSISERFHATHGLRHGHSNPGAPFEVVVLRVVALGELERAAPELLSPAGEPRTLSHRVRHVNFGIAAPEETTIVDRDQLRPNDIVTGPAIIEELTATTVVPPGFTCVVEPHGALIMRSGH